VTTAPGSPVNPLPRFAALSGAYFATMGVFAPCAPLWFQSLGMGTVAIGAISSLQSRTRVFTPYAWGSTHGRWCWCWRSCRTR
jgi:PPP family 3-phenylpropionic acid transporter